jgi:DNA-directed RNA polymerase subunit RPC12/RpoP
MAVTGYCLKCKKTVEIKDAQPITMKNGKPATTGVCPTCGTKIYKIGKAA